MRILLACPYAWDVPGGVQVHVRQLGMRLSHRGHEVLAVTPGRAEAPEPWVRVVGRPIRVPYNGTVAPICASRTSWQRVRDLMEVFEPDVVHVHEPLTPSTSMFATLASRAPVVATFHAYLRRSRLLTAAAPALGFVLRRVRARIAVSEAAASFVSGPFPGAVEVVPNGVDTAMFAGAAPSRELPEGRRMLWVGRLDPQKAFPVALRAFGMLAGEFPDLSLVVAGDGPERGAVATLGPQVARRVLMLGSVRHDDLPPYHASADLLMAPASGQESFGIVLVEAMAAGLPVVCTDIPGYREVVRHEIEGLIVPPDDAVALADAVRRVLRDPGLAAALGASGVIRAAEFDWERVVPRLESVYRRATGDPGG